MRHDLPAPLNAPNPSPRSEGSPGNGAEATVLGFPSTYHGREPAAEPLSASQRRRLRRLRVLAIESRLVPRHNFWNAYARVLGDGRTCPRVIASLLFKNGAEAYRRRLEFYRPDARAVSADEHWLLRLLDAVERGETWNIRALIAFRIHTPYRRAFTALVARFLDETASLFSKAPNP